MLAYANETEKSGLSPEVFEPVNRQTARHSSCNFDFGRIRNLARKGKTPQVAIDAR